MEEKQKCPVCGKEYTPKSRFGADNTWSIEGKDIFCLDCQERKFNQILADTGDEFLTLYFCTLFFNRPWDARIAKDVIASHEVDDDPHWMLYMRKMKEAGQLNSGR